jgi:hypothetical protein
MALLFCDGFDNYSAILDFWDFNSGGGNNNIVTTGQARTGRGCLAITGALGPVKTLPHYTNLLLATCWSSDQAGSVFAVSNTDADVGYSAQVVTIDVLADGNVRAYRHPAGGGNLLGQTNTAGLVVFNSYVSIAAQIVCSATVGSVTVWVNGNIVLALTGLNTTFPGRADIPYFNAVQLMGPGGLPNCFHDDFYLLDCSTPPHQTFLGALKLYAIAPTANASVVWTPLAGTNWSEVNEVPPDGDTSYNSSGNVGDQDQYNYPLTGVPANSIIAFIQHELDMKVDAGGRTVGSVVQAATPANPVALTTGYHIYCTPYDSQPGGSAIWTPATFPITAGPKVTA